MYNGARSGALRAPDLAEQSEVSWKALGSIWRASGNVLETSWKLLGSLLGALGGLLQVSWKSLGVLSALLCSLLSALALKMAPKRLANRPPNGSKTAPKSILGRLGALLELS